MCVGSFLIDNASKLLLKRISPNLGSGIPKSQQLAESSLPGLSEQEVQNLLKVFKTEGKTNQQNTRCVVSK